MDRQQRRTLTEQLLYQEGIVKKYDQHQLEGVSAKAITDIFNKEQIPSSSGRPWTPNMLLSAVFRYRKEMRPRPVPAEALSETLRKVVFSEQLDNDEKIKFIKVLLTETSKENT